jgi:hypothetical protein
MEVASDRNNNKEERKDQETEDQETEGQEEEEGEEEKQLDAETSRDIYTVLRARELQVPKYKGVSPQLYYRRCLVDWLSLVSKQLNLCNRVLHISIKYLDLVMDKFEFPKETQLTLLSICCLWIAAKLDEHDDLIPSLASLKNVVQDNFNCDDFLQMELIIMQSLDWRLLLPTAEQFIGHYMESCLCETDLHCCHPITNIRKARSYVAKYVSYFLEVSLQDYMFYAFLPSLVAASILAASRICVKITPTWMPLLVQKTGYDYGDIEACVQRLMDIHSADEFKANQVLK